jgi:hypothetical protein
MSTPWLGAQQVQPGFRRGYLEVPEAFLSARLQNLLPIVHKCHEVVPNVATRLINVLSDERDRVRSKNITLLPNLNLSQRNWSLAIPIELVQASICTWDKADIVVVHFIFGAGRHGRVAFDGNCSVRLFNLDRCFEEPGSLLGLAGNGVAEEPEKWRVLFCRKCLRQTQRNFKPVDM